MDDVLRLLPEPDAAGDYGWGDGSVVWYDGPGWRWESADAYSEDGYVTALEAALKMADICPGSGPSRLAVAHHYHPPKDAEEAMAWAVLAGDRQAAYLLADAVGIDRERPKGAKTVAERESHARNAASLLDWMPTGIDDLRKRFIRGELSSPDLCVELAELRDRLVTVQEELRCANGSATTSASESPTPATGGPG